jgi:predicted ATPase
VTLTGSGGIGKTRLAIALGYALVDDFPDGVFVVNLAPVRDAALVVSAIAQALDVGEIGGQRLIDTLRATLRTRRLLLIVDNVEHVVEAATVLSDLIDACPHLSVLATSRLRLRLRGEQEYPVPPLPFPDQMSRLTPNSLVQYAAVALFLRRAREVSPYFQVTDASAQAVAEICMRLDGLPLAIELAAARIKVLPAAALLLRLEQRLPLLTGGRRDAPVRQQTLRDTIAWSEDLLPEAERRLFRRLSVFVGGWSLEAATAVVGITDADGHATPVDVFAGIATLIDHSLVRQHATAEGSPRFSMLETIREFGLEQLAHSGEHEAMRQRHGQYWTDLVEELEPRLEGVDQYTIQDHIEQEQANMRAALDWFIERQDVAAGLRLAGTLGIYWQLRGYFSEGRHYYQMLFALPRQDIAPRIRAKGLTYAGVLAHWQRDDAAALALEEEALRIWQTLPLSEQYEAWQSLVILGRLAHDQGEMEAAREWYEELLAHADRVAAGRNVAARRVALFSLGEIALTGGDISQATALFHESAAQAQEAGDLWTLTVATVNLGYLALNQDGDLDRMRSVLEHALLVYRRTGIRAHVAKELNALGQLDLLQGRIEPARLRFEEALSIARAIGERIHITSGLRGMGEVALHIGDLNRAAECLREALLLAQAIGHPRPVIESIESVAVLYLEHGDDETAVRLIAAATNARDTFNIPEMYLETRKVDRFVSSVRSRIPGERYAAAWREGWAFSLDGAVSRVLTDESLWPGDSCQREYRPLSSPVECTAR